MLQGLPSHLWPKPMRLLTVHRDFYSPHNWGRDVVGRTALVLPRLFPRDPVDLQVFVFAQESHSCKGSEEEKPQI